MAACRGGYASKTHFHYLKKHGGDYGKYAENTFDIISLFQTIEYIENPKQLLNDMKFLLNENGRVYIVCHSYRATVNRILGFKSPIYDIEHLQLFSKRGIRVLLEQCGYTDIKVFTICNAYPLSMSFR